MSTPALPPGFMHIPWRHPPWVILDRTMVAPTSINLRPGAVWLADPQSIRFLPPGEPDWQELELFLAGGALC